MDTDLEDHLEPGLLLGDLIRELDRAAPFDLVEVCERWLQRRIRARWSALLLVDYSQTILEPVPGHGSDDPKIQRQAVRDSPAGEAYREQRAVSAPLDSRDVVAYLPVTIRTERLGVLMVAMDPSAGQHVPDIMLDAARVLAHVLASARRYTDRFETLRRRRDLGLAAEIQWELLPVLAYELPSFSIAGALEPTYDIGGDTFDYAVSSSTLTISITDAVGHGLAAALLASLAVTAMRNSRRCGENLLRQATVANNVLNEQFPGTNFVTGLLLELDVSTGSGMVVNAGHPPPMLLRQGTVEHLELVADLPLGLFENTVYRTQAFNLLPADRLLLMTDGIPEAHPRGGVPFGVERVEGLLREQVAKPPSEFVRELTAAVLDFKNGELADDATAVCLDWH